MAKFSQATDDNLRQRAAHAPAPVTVEDAGDIHAVFGSEAQEILHGNDDCLSRAGE